MFRDSDRESVVSYFNKNGGVSQTRGLDTPTRILSHSNEFLPITYSEALMKAMKDVEELQSDNKKNKEVLLAQECANLICPPDK